IYGANYIGWYPGANWSTLLDWIANTGLDVGSLSANPLWANVNALDFHLQSTAGRWNPSTQAWVTDASDSPALDAADPTEDFSQEQSNNGNRANIGSYGNTPEASKSQTALNVGRVRIDPTGELFNGLGPALVNLATVKSPFTQDYTVTLGSGTYYEGAGSTAAINTNGFQLTIQGDPSVSTTSVVFAGGRGYAAGIWQGFTAASKFRLRRMWFQNYAVNANARGIQLSGGQLDISSVTVSGNWDGMVLTGQPGSTVQWNTAINNIYGIYLAAGSGTLVAHNQIVSTVGDGNTRAGIVIDTSTGNKIKFNDLYLTNPTNNGYRYGIYLLNTSSGATVTNNNLAVDALGNGSGYRVGLYFGDTPSRTGFYSNY